MAKLKILTEGNPILRKKSKEVGVVDKKTGHLISEMIETMKTADGLGIAAPQVGRSVRIICVKTKDGPLVLINPLIKKKSLFKSVAEEGCLSVPGVFGRVKRHKKIEVTAQNIEQKRINFTAKGLLARIIQHEIDHLEGILFIDRIEKKKAEKKDERAL